MSNTNTIKDLPKYLQVTVIKLLCEYLVMLEHLPCSDGIYLHVVSHTIDHLRELSNTSVITSNTSSKPSVHAESLIYLKHFVRDIQDSGEVPSAFFINNLHSHIDELTKIVDGTSSNTDTYNTSAPNKEVINNASIVNNHLKEQYEILLSMLSNDLSNTEVMDKIKAFKLLHPEVVNSFHKVTNTSSSNAILLNPSEQELFNEYRDIFSSFQFDTSEPIVMSKLVYLKTHQPNVYKALGEIMDIFE